MQEYFLIFPQIPMWIRNIESYHTMNDQQKLYRWDSFWIVALVIGTWFHICWSHCWSHLLICTWSKLLYESFTFVTDTASNVTGKYVTHTISLVLVQCFSLGLFPIYITFIMVLNKWDKKGMKCCVMLFKFGFASYESTESVLTGVLFIAGFVHEIESTASEICVCCFVHVTNHC